MNKFFHIFKIDETESKNLLISTEKTISEIAYELGYKESSFFLNVFKKKQDNHQVSLEKR